MFKYIIVLFWVSYASASSEAWELLFNNKPKKAIEIFEKSKSELDKVGLVEALSYLGDYAKSNERILPTDYNESLWLYSYELYRTLELRKNFSKEDSLRLLSYSTKFGHEDLLTELHATRAFKKGKLEETRKLLKSVGFLTSWKWFGPVKEGFLKPIQDISNFEQKIPNIGESSYQANGDKISWQHMEHERYSPWIYLNDHISSTKDAYFLFNSFTSDNDQKAILNLGVSGRFQVFVNGKSVGYTNEFQNVGTGYFKFAVDLKKGKNEVLLQLSHSKKSLLAQNNEHLNFNLFFTDYKLKKKLLLKEATLSSKSIQIRSLKSAKIHYVETFVTKREQKLKSLWMKSKSKVALYFLARHYWRNNEFVKAEPYILLLKKQLSNSALVKQFLARYYTSRGDHVNYEKAMKEIYELDKNNYKGWAYTFSQLVKDLNPSEIAKFVKETPKHFEKTPIYMQAQMLLSFSEQNTVQAMSWVQKLIDYPEKTQTLINALYRLLPEISKHKELEEVLKQEVEKNPSIYSYRLLLYNFYNGTGNKEQAKRVLLEAEIFFPDEMDLKYYLATLYFLNKEYKEALVRINACLRVAPLAENALKLKSNILAALGDKQQAKETLHILKDYTTYDFVAYDQIRDLENKKPFFQISAFPKVQELWMKLDSSELAKENKVVIINDQTNVVVYGKGTVKRYYQQAIYLPKQSDVDNWKERSLSWNSAFQKFNLLKAETVKRNGKTVDADIGSKFVFINVEPGDMILLEWEISDFYEGDVAKNLEIDKSYYAKIFQIQSKINIIYPKGMSLNPKLYLSEGLTKKAKVVDEDYLQDSFEFRPSTSILLESNVPSSFSKVKWINYSSWGSWSNVSEWYLKLSEQDIPVELRSLTDSIVEGVVTQKEKIQRIHKYIVENIRYSSVSFRQSGWIPQPILEILSSKIGDCKDMASLGRAMLSHIGVKSELVLVHTGIKRAFDKVSIGPNFNHAILAFESDGQTLYMDPTAAQSHYANLPSANVGAMALKVGKGQKRFALPLQGRKSISRTARDSLSDDGAFVRQVKTIRRNSYASALRRDYRFLDQEERNKALQKVIGKTYSGAVVNHFVLSDLERLDDSISYEYHFLVKEAAQSVGKMKLFKWVITDSYVESNIPSEEVRKTPYDYFYYGPSTAENKGSLVFPENWALVDVPNSKKIETKWGEYTISFKVKKNKIEYSRKLEWNYKDWILPSEYSEFRDTLKEILKGDDLNLLFKPR